MKISASKPHFFKLILPGFENGLKIPTYFSKYMLGTANGYPDGALLKKKGQEWRVSVTNEYFVGDGWSRFAEENLEPGDFVVFKHRGNMVFNVVIFDGITQCRKEHLTQPERRPSKKSRFEAAALKEGPKKIPMDHGEEEEVADVIGSPHFVGTIKQYNIDGRYVYVPRAFTRSNGLVGRKCKIIVKDEQERSWYFDLSSGANDRDDARITGKSELIKIFRANGFKKGDSYKLEVEVAGPREETLVVRILPTKKKVSNQGKGNVVEVIDISESENNGGPYFTSTIKPYFKNYHFHIPMKFARLNGLCVKSQMILEDKRRRTWQVKLVSDGRHLSITSGWKNFVDENGIKEGDAFKFEIVENEAVPIVRFIVINDSLKR